MKAVSRFESNLLRILHCFLRREPLTEVRPLVVNRSDKARPPCLSREAVALVQDALAKGTVQLLARAGGWRKQRFLRNDRPVLGRLWERTPPQELGLRFSGQTLELLLCVTAHKPAELKAHWEPAPDSLTLGDQLLLYFAYDALRDSDARDQLNARPAFVAHPLCRLAFADDYTTITERPAPDYGPWTTGVGSCILEALQDELAGQCVRAERAKSAVGDWQRMRAMGQAQEQALTAFLDAATAARRPDLARFLLQAAVGLLPEGVPPRQWVGGLKSAGPRMADRAETHRAALAFVRQLARLKRWEQEARAEGYFDEGYARSQLWLSDWERFGGDDLNRRAQGLVQELDPLRPTGGEPGPAAPGTPLPSGG
jgi:hypothetical protein